VVSPGQGGDVTLIRSGSHSVSVVTAGIPGPKKAGFTRGAITLTFSPSKRNVLVSEYGATPVDEYVIGVVLVVKFSMVERSLKVLDIALNGLYPLNYGTATANRGVGKSGIAKASVRGGTVTLHPLSVTGTGQDIVLQQVMLCMTGSLSIDENGEELFEVEGTCTVLAAGTDGALLAIINESNVGA
jgi:hypothetical protein